MKKRRRVIWTLIYALVAALSAYVLYYAFGAPSFTAEMAMHRKEKARLLGPSRVIATDDVEDSKYAHIILGETENGYCLYEYNTEFGVDSGFLIVNLHWDSGMLTYKAKDDAATVFCSEAYIDVTFDQYMPVYAIPADSRAVSAKLTLYTKETRSEVYEESHTAQAELRQGTYFLFQMDMTEMDAQVRYFWKNRLRGYNSGNGYTYGKLTLELYNSRGELIDTVVREFPAYL